METHAYFFNSVYAHIVLNSLDENIKLASESGLHCDLRATRRGLVLNMSGFRIHMPVLLREVVDRIKKCNFTPGEFHDASEKVSSC